MRLAAAALISVLLGLSACSKSPPPVGKWEGGYQAGGDIVVARVEVLASGQVKVMAPDVTDVPNSQDEIDRFRTQLSADLANDWPQVAPRDFDFDGSVFRKPGGVAPQMEWDKSTNQMTLDLFIGARPALPIPLHPVDDFHDNPFASG
jgi:hypothetical protein